jgi:hypothetical protein
MPNGQLVLRVEEEKRRKVRFQSLARYILRVEQLLHQWNKNHCLNV